MFCLETFISDYWEKKTRIENQQLFYGIIDITLFDRVEGLDFYVLKMLIIFVRFQLGWKIWKQQNILCVSVLIVVQFPT